MNLYFVNVMFNLVNRLFVRKSLFLSLAFFLSPALFPIPSPFQRKGRRDGEVLVDKIPIPDPFQRKGRRDGKVLVDRIPIPDPFQRKGRRDGEVLVDKIPIPDPFQRKGRRDGKVLVDKIRFFVVFCHSDLGGITLFFCVLLYVIPPSSERQTGCLGDEMGKFLSPALSEGKGDEM